MLGLGPSIHVLLGPLKPMTMIGQRFISRANIESADEKRRYRKMFGWLKKKAAQQSLFNVEINARTLIVASNKANASIEKTSSSEPALTKKVVAAQEALLTDIQLALENGARFEDVRARIEIAKSKEAVTRGAEMAIAHVLTYVVR